MFFWEISIAENSFILNGQISLRYIVLNNMCMSKHFHKINFWPLINNIYDFMTITTWFSILFFLFSLKFSVNELFFVTLKYDSSFAASEMKIQENLCQFAFSLFRNFLPTQQYLLKYSLLCSHGNFPLVFCYFFGI